MNEKLRVQPTKIWLSSDHPTGITILSEVIPFSLPTPWEQCQHFFLHFTISSFFFSFFILRATWSNWYFRRISPVSERRMNGRTDWSGVQLGWGQMPYPDKLRAWLREDWRVRSVVPGTGRSKTVLRWHKCSFWRWIGWRVDVGGGCWGRNAFGTFREHAQR